MRVYESIEGIATPCPHGTDVTRVNKCEITNDKVLQKTLYGATGPPTDSADLV